MAKIKEEVTPEVTPTTEEVTPDTEVVTTDTEEVTPDTVVVTTTTDEVISTEKLPVDAIIEAIELLNKSQHPFKHNFIRDLEGMVERLQ